MRSFLINKNITLYYRLKRRIGNKPAFRIANEIEKVVTIFGREQIPEQQKSVLENEYIKKNRM
jgi:hypothetical protein